jgi:predicted GNAT superfamily acetyltransferase
VLDPELTSTAWLAAESSAASAGVTVCALERLDELDMVDSLFGEIWGAKGAQVAMPVNLLRALTYSGGYVAGAWQGQSLVGAGVGFLGVHEGTMDLHSHVVGVAKESQGSGIGFAIKLHQRAWALERSIRRITWTFDPLVRRNARLNLVKLGAKVPAYYANFYGVMVDDLNGTDETDRCLAIWDLLAVPALSSVPSEAGGVRLLADSVSGRPAIVGDGPSAEDLRSDRLLCQVPGDAVALRQHDRELARDWRLALRHTMGRVIEAGFVATTITPDGWYVLERPHSGEPAP